MRGAVTGSQKNMREEAGAAERADYAEALAAAGFAPFPLAPREKVPPKGSRWSNTGAGNPAAVRAAFNAAPFGANVGLRTEGWLALDVDVDADGKRNPWLTAARVREFAGAPQIATPRGGRHFYFRLPDGLTLRNTTDRIAPGVDTRANGGYVVAPSSLVKRRRYRHVGGPRPEEVGVSGLPEPPAWLVDILTAKPGGATAPTGAKQGDDSGKPWRQKRVKPPLCCRCDSLLPSREKKYRVGTWLSCRACRPTVRSRWGVKGGDLLNLGDQLVARREWALNHGDFEGGAELTERLDGLQSKLFGQSFKAGSGGAGSAKAKASARKRKSRRLANAERKPKVRANRSRTPR
ncbi:bifunctional DNA primase/polymerase [Alienimonas sp. DA493]|uniref:bifunctional DNA primase/polymerase n=1 Tax=Alienimonas sp. DA493 TaxID=3373605 RepID=UPI003754B6EE